MTQTKATDPRRLRARAMDGADLRRARGMLAMSQTEIANVLGIAQNSWGRWEREDVPTPSWLAWAVLGLIAEAQTSDYGTVANLLNLITEGDDDASQDTQSTA